MGYDMRITKVDFCILSKNKKKALKAVKSLFDKDITKSYSWVEEDEVRKAKNIEDALIAWGWELELDNNGDIINIEFLDEKLGNEDTLFNAIAPYVVSGSYIQMQGEDGSNWRWFFKNGKCINQEGRILFPYVKDKKNSDVVIIDEEETGTFRVRAFRLTNNCIEIVTELKDVDTGKWEVLDDKFIDSKEIKACNELFNRQNISAPPKTLTRHR